MEQKQQENRDEKDKIIDNLNTELEMKINLVKHYELKIHLQSQTIDNLSLTVSKLKAQLLANDILPQQINNIHIIPILEPINTNNNNELYFGNNALNIINNQN